MSADENKVLAQRFMAALASSGDLGVLDELCSPQVAHEWQENMDGFPFSERAYTVDDMVADDSKVAILWTSESTHTGEVEGISATGMRLSGSGSAFFTVDGGKIAKVESYYDAEDLYRQLGATITPAR